MASSGMELEQADARRDDVESGPATSSSETLDASSTSEEEELQTEKVAEERRQAAREQIGAVLSAGDGILGTLSAPDADWIRVLVRAATMRLKYKGFKSDIELHLAAGALRNKVGTLVTRATKLLEQLDAVLSFGDSVIASERRAAAKRTQAIINLADARFQKAKALVAFIERLRALPPYSLPGKTAKEQDANMDEGIKVSEKPQETVRSPSPDPLPTRPSPTPDSLPTRSFPTPNYEIKDSVDSVVISMPLPKGLDVERDLQFSTNEKRLDSLSILGFDDPIKLSVDPRRMDLSKTTYRVLQGPRRVLKVVIPKLRPLRAVPPFGRRSGLDQMWF